MSEPYTVFVWIFGPGQPVDTPAPGTEIAFAYIKRSDGSVAGDGVCPRPEPMTISAGCYTVVASLTAAERKPDLVVVRDESGEFAAVAWALADGANVVRARHGMPY